MYKNKIINRQKQQFQLNRYSQIFYNVAGIEKSERGQNKEAIEYFTRAIKLNPKDAISYFNRATLKVSIGDIKGARSDFKKSENFYGNNKLTITDYPIL
ncbi:MAG: tetratricopeptide repeat protein [Ignavibacteria bacterium]|nr:tetratricopeptide repeat protein [Ignavibacteria bacterium]